MLQRARYIGESDTRVCLNICFISQASGGCLVGKTFSMADVAVFPYIAFLIFNGYAEHLIAVHSDPVHRKKH